MDKTTFEALQEIIAFAKQAEKLTIYPDAHFEAFAQLEGWMDEVAKEITD